MCSLYKIVVLPAASSPSMTTCQEAHQLSSIDGGDYVPRKQCNSCKNLSYPHFFVPEDSVQHLTHGVSHFAPRILGLKPLGCLGQGLRGAFSALWEALCGSNQTIEAAQPPFMVLEDHHLPTINLSCKMHLRKRCPTSMKDNGTF